jgi:hypothetical protein
MLGAMLFEGDHVPRQTRGVSPALAKDSARADQAWITKLYDSAMQQASEDERALAAVYPAAGWGARRIDARPRERGSEHTATPRCQP